MGVPICERCSWYIAPTLLLKDHAHLIYSDAMCGNEMAHMYHLVTGDFTNKCASLRSWEQAGWSPSDCGPKGILYEPKT